MLMLLNITCQVLGTDFLRDSLLFFFGRLSFVQACHYGYLHFRIDADLSAVDSQTLV